ncbi:hypothetical protein VULLAG_LOCUS20434 [Vulpes lagopus]
MQKPSAPSNNSDTLFISSLRDASIQTIRKNTEKMLVVHIQLFPSFQNCGAPGDRRYGRGTKKDLEYRSDEVHRFMPCQLDLPCFFQERGG